MSQKRSTEWTSLGNDVSSNMQRPLNSAHFSNKTDRHTFRVVTTLKIFWCENAVAERSQFALSWFMGSCSLQSTLAGNEEVLRPNLVGGEFYRKQTPRFS